MTLGLILLVIALGCFIFACISRVNSPVPLVPLGLACCVASVLFGGYMIG